MALMFTFGLQKSLVFIIGRQSFFPFAIARQTSKAEQAIADSMLFRQEALLNQCKARRIAQSTFGVWDGSALGAGPISPATAIRKHTYELRQLMALPA
jgi:hypothetical protein